MDDSMNGKEVTLRGWIYRVRCSNRMIFLVLRDESGIIQGVASREDLGEESFQKVGKLLVESSVLVAM